MDVIWEKGSRVAFLGVPATVEEQRKGYAMIKFDTPYPTAEGWSGRVMCVQASSPELEKLVS